MRLNANQIKKYINSDKYDFKQFNINYNMNEKKCIDSFTLDKTQMYSYYGSLENISINKFLSELGNNNINLVNKMKKIILKLVQKVLDGYNMEYFWLAIRVTQPNNMYDIPRWHKDGAMLVNNEMSKFITTLKGPGTLFIKSTKRLASMYNKINKLQMDEQGKYPYDNMRQDANNLKEQQKVGEKYRIIYAKKFKNEQIIQLDNNMGAIFFTGSDKDKDKAALHSEPKNTIPRMFISILPNSKENIEKIKEFSQR